MLNPDLSANTRSLKPCNGGGMSDPLSPVILNLGVTHNAQVHNHWNGAAHFLLVESSPQSRSSLTVAMSPTWIFVPLLSVCEFSAKVPAAFHSLF